MDIGESEGPRINQGIHFQGKGNPIKLRKGRTMSLGFAFIVVLVIAQATMAAPPSFARLELNESYSHRNMTVSSVETIDLMDLSLSEVTLSSTTGDNLDIKTLTLPDIQNIRRIFTSNTSSWSGNTLTILGEMDSTVSGSVMNTYTFFIEPKVPVIRCQVDSADGDVFLSRRIASGVSIDFSSLFKNTDRLYILHQDGALGLDVYSNGTPGNITAINVDPGDFDPEDMAFTLFNNENTLTPFSFSRDIAQDLSSSTHVIPKSGEFLAYAFRYDPSPPGKIITYAAWPVIILEEDSQLNLDTHVYNKRSGDDLTLTFSSPPVNNLSYILIKEDETYDAQIWVNMTALEETGGAVSMDLILSGNPFVTILKYTGLVSDNFNKVVSYSINATGNSTPPNTQDPSKINITPGYGTSGYALHTHQVNIPHDDLQALLSGDFNIYALGADLNNTIVALNQDTLSIGYSPLANFTATPIQGLAHLAVSFSDLSTDNPTSWAWNFGDDSPNGTVKNPVHTYLSPGLYTVTLTATNEFGLATEQKVQYINVTGYAPPVAGFTATPLSGYTPLTVYFTDQSTNSPTEWEWEYRIGSGSWTVFSTAQNPSSIFTTIGQYSIRLTATNAAGSHTLTRSNYITVTEPPLNAGFTANPTSGFVPLFVQFTDTSTGTITSRSWTFGDGGTSSATNPSHTYTATGTYTVKLTVTGPGGPDSETGSITVYSVPPEPSAKFTANITSGRTPLSVQFTDQSTQSPYDWNWSFGDATWSTDRNPVHVYQGPGNYTVSLWVRGLGGFDTETKFEYIHVIPTPPVVNFTANITSGEAPLAVQFTDLSTNNPTMWSWSFGDSTSSSEQNPVHIYQYAGNYTVSLTAANPEGTGSLVKVAYINVSGLAPPTPVLKADFVGAPTYGFAPLTVLFADVSTGSPNSWNWSFGDGITSDSQNPSHIYTTVGGYTVSLTVSNGTADDTTTKFTYISVSRRGGTGGGGGGGGGGGTFLVTPTPTPTATATPTPIPTSTGTLPLGTDNRTTQPVTIGSYDGVATISIGAGVTVTCDDGTPIRDLSISPVPDGSLPNLPGEPVYMGYAYNITPECTSFDPAVVLTFSFTPEQWSALAGRDLVMMWYDPAKGGWVSLPTSIDQAGRAVITGISDGGIYGLFAKSPVTTPIQTEVPETTPSPPGPELPWTWILVGGVAVAAIGGGAYYFLKKRANEEEPPGGDELS